jgi:PAT family beta-lactamase induction signal transducer AmpG
MLCAMYVAQGIPWGFMTVALVSYLTEHGLGDREAGKLTALFLLPWTFKLVWAPLIDTITIRSMGRRRPWIISAQLMMALSLLCILAMNDLTSDLSQLGWIYFVHNCFASLQDVSTDALAVDILPLQEQGRTNGFMWGSKLLGKAVGASLMSVVINRLGLVAAVWVQFGALLSIMLFPILLLERPGERRFPWSGSESGGVGRVPSLRSPTKVVYDLVCGFATTTTASLLAFGIVSDVGWGVVEIITKTLYTYELGWDFVRFSHVSAVAVGFELVGALLGGFLADRYSRRMVMVLGFGGYGVLAIVFGSCPQLWSDAWLTTGYLLLNPGLLAVGQVGFLSMAMRVSWTDSAATMFTIYMAASNVGHVIGNWLVGEFRSQDGLALSYAETFWVAGLAALLPLVLLVLMRSKASPASVQPESEIRINNQSEDLCR